MQSNITLNQFISEHKLLSLWWYMQCTVCTVCPLKPSLLIQLISIGGGQSITWLHVWLHVHMVTLHSESQVVCLSLSLALCEMLFRHQLEKAEKPGSIIEILRSAKDKFFSLESFFLWEQIHHLKWNGPIMYSYMNVVQSNTVQSNRATISLI